MPYKDKEKYEQYRERSKQRRYESSRSIRLANRGWFDEQKKKPCLDCGVSYPPIVMEFHHRDKSQKEITPSQALARRSRQGVLDEIAKCDLLCANCHRLRHVDDGDWGQRNS